MMQQQLKDTFDTEFIDVGSYITTNSSRFTPGFVVNILFIWFMFL